MHSWVKLLDRRNRLDRKNHHIIIKGTRDGLTLYLDDSCSFDHLIVELDRVLSQDDLEAEDSLVRINIQLGYRHLHTDQEKILRDLIRKKEKISRPKH